MKRRMLLGSMAFAVLPSMAAAPQSKTLLTVGGRIGRVNNEAADTFEFTEAEFLKLGSTRITTGTPWTPTSVLDGPLLIDVMQAAGSDRGIEVHLASQQDRSKRIGEVTDRRHRARLSVELVRVGRRSGDKPSSKGFGWRAVLALAVLAAVAATTALLSQQLTLSRRPAPFPVKAFTGLLRSIRVRTAG